MATRRRWLRYGLVLVVLLVIVAGLGGIKGCQISRLMAFGKAMEAAGPPPEAVGTSVARAVTWDSTLTAVGTVTGHETVSAANVLPGRVESIRFESGQTVRQGQVLVELDARLEKAQLESARSRRALALITTKRARELAGKQAIPIQDLDNAETVLTGAEADISALQAQIEYKVVRAPFAGHVGIRAVNLGQYLAPGTAVTSVDSLGEMYVDFPLPQETIAILHTGMPVSISVRGKQIADGKLAAIDPTLDPVTRTLRLRAEVPNAGALRSGMFVTVAVVLPEKRQVVIVPLTAILHAAYGDSVFVVEDKPEDEPGLRRSPDGKEVKVVRQQFVRTGATRGDFVQIVKGLRAGETVVSEGAFKLRNGAPVVIDNRVKPDARIDPRPENR